MDKVSYALGMSIGQQLKDLGAASLSIDDFAQAIKDTLAGHPQLSAEAAAVAAQAFFAAQESAQQGRAAQQGQAAKAEGEQFLAANKAKDGVVCTASGLQYMVLRAGEGKTPRATDTVVCHYEGFLTNGTVFDSSYARNAPATFALNQVIAGWTEGLQLMAEGAKYRFFIPYQLGYGARGAGQQIPPYSVLIFDVELIEVK